MDANTPQPPVPRRNSDPSRSGEGDRGYLPAEIAEGLPSTYTGGENVGYGYEDEGNFNVWSYLDVLYRRRWTIGAVFAASALITAVFTLAATPMFRSTALLQIQPNGPNILSFDEVQESMGQTQAYQDFFQTQYSILASRALAKRTIEKLGLEDNPVFNEDLNPPTGLKRLLSWFGGETEEVDPMVAALEEEQRLTDALLDEVDIQPRRKSFLVELSYSSPDRLLAAKVAETLAHEYIDLTLDQRIDSASQGRDFIEKQLAVTKARLEQSEKALQEFARGRDIYALEQEEKVIHERLADLNSRLTAAEGERIDLGASFEQASGPGGQASPSFVSDELVKRLSEERTTLEVELAQLRQTFTDEYPQVRTLQARIATLEDAMRAEEERIVASLGNDHEAAKLREASIAAELEKQREHVAAYETKAIDFKIMRREVDTNRSIYESLLQRSKEVAVAEAVRASNVSILDAPEIPLKHSRPSIPLNMTLAMLFGVFGGVGIAVAQEYLDDSVKTPEDVESAARLPTLATIPEFAVLEDASADDPTSLDREVALHPTSSGAEAVRTLRASLFLAAPGGLPSRLLMTSARPGEGKTCISTNLSIALAQMGRKVVLIDCDLRKPRVHAAMRLDQTPGLSSYLTGAAAVDEIIRPSSFPGMDVITSGPVPPNPVDLVDSPRMTALLEELDERYDNILVDAPPSLVFADVPILTKRLGGGCLVVAHSGETPKRALKQSCDYLIRMQSKLLGVVLNRVSRRSTGYSYYSQYGYYGDYYTATEGTAEMPAIERDRPS